MPTLLLEIGCEELPALACREASRQLPELSEKHLGVKPSHVLVGPPTDAIRSDGAWAPKGCYRKRDARIATRLLAQSAQRDCRGTARDRAVVLTASA